MQPATRKDSRLRRTAGVRKISRPAISRTAPSEAHSTYAKQRRDPQSGTSREIISLAGLNSDSLDAAVQEEGLGVWGIRLLRKRQPLIERERVVLRRGL